MKTEEEIFQDYKDWIIESGEDLQTMGAKYRSWKAAYITYIGEIKSKNKKEVVIDPKFDIIQKENKNVIKETSNKKEDSSGQEQKNKSKK